jgi:glutamine amidotransferase
MEDTGLKNEILLHAIEKQRPLLGICLGMQLLGSVSEEGGDHKGLDLIPGKIVRLKDGNKKDKIPNIGWSEVRFNEANELFSGIERNSCFYHIHSFFYEGHHPDVGIASINFSGEDVTVSVQKNNIFGVQFHPEKSHAAGIKLLQNFSEI